MRISTIAALTAATALLAACAATPKAAPDSLDMVARDYVALTLEIGEREPGYVDAYYGPAEWAEAAKAHPRGLPQLAEGAAALSRRLEALPTAGLDVQSRQRRAYLGLWLRINETRHGTRRLSITDPRLQRCSSPHVAASVGRLRH